MTAFLEWLTPSSLATLKPYSSTLSVLLNEEGGIIDDTMITKHSDEAFYVVTNAGTREKDLTWFHNKLAEWNTSEHAREGAVEHEVLENWGLIALQGASLRLSPLPLYPLTSAVRPCRCCSGPQAAQYLQGLTTFDLKGLTFGRSAYVPIEGFNLHVARGGYTGEDGFEVSNGSIFARISIVTKTLARYPFHRHRQSK